MKYKIVLLVFVLLISITFSQTQLFANNYKGDVIKFDPKDQPFANVPGFLLVKLKDDAVVSLAKIISLFIFI
jgi:hypothetical protein